MSTAKFSGDRWNCDRNGKQWILRYYEGEKRLTHRVPSHIQDPQLAKRYVTTFLSERLRVDRGTGQPPLLSGQQINPRITFRQFGELWSSGALHEMFPHRIRNKKSASSDTSRLECHVYPVIGDIQVRAFIGTKGLNWAEDVLKHLPPRRHRSARQIAQVVNRLLTLAAYPAIQLIPSNPLPKGYVPPAPSKKAKSYLYPEEEAQLMANQEISLKLRVFFGLMIREGARLGNFLNLRFSHLDLRVGVIRFDETKTDAPISWVMDPGTTEALRRYRDRFCRGRASRDFVFLDSDGHLRIDDKVLHPTKLASTLRSVLKKSGVTRAELFENTKNRMNFRVHDLRTSFITVKLAMGKSETWVMDRTGHQSSQMIATYRQKARSHIEANLGDYLPLWEAIPELRDE